VSLIRGFSFIRLAVVKNKLPNSITGSSDSREVVTKFYYDCDTDSVSNSDINCIEVSDSKEKSYSSSVRAPGTCICTQKDWE
jgi:hypothetical protein